MSPPPPPILWRCATDASMRREYGHRILNTTSCVTGAGAGTHIRFTLRQSELKISPFSTKTGSLPPCSVAVHLITVYLPRSSAAYEAQLAEQKSLLRASYAASGGVNSEEERKEGDREPGPEVSSPWADARHSFRCALCGEPPVYALSHVMRRERGGSFDDAMSDGGLRALACGSLEQ
ncbi:unnamed protein product [Cyclocybe aegerita]|uniref:Uncharacterized protein n=1 Tax=Cyclocybe aegerita TaxID=1973307 RepID=A0A8S0WCW8_CYCAE|nr:unnamed protein product [Cyclocybe aegerita]